MNLTDLARFLFLAAAVLALIGGLLLLTDKLGIPWGRLPGDVRIERENFSCVFALGTSLLLSVVLTIFLNLIVRLLNR